METVTPDVEEEIVVVVIGTSLHSKQGLLGHFDEKAVWVFSKVSPELVSYLATYEKSKIFPLCCINKDIPIHIIFKTTLPYFIKR